MKIEHITLALPAAIDTLDPMVEGVLLPNLDRPPRRSTRSWQPDGSPTAPPSTSSRPCGRTALLCRGSPTDWSSNADGGSWTFNLRKGVKFSDGSPLTVDDVMYPYQYILTNNTRAKNYIAQLKQIYKLSDTQVRMDLTQPMSVWPRAVNIFPSTAPPIGRAQGHTATHQTRGG